MIGNYVSIKEVLYNLSMLVNEVDYKDEEFSHFAHQALRMFRGVTKMQDLVYETTIEDHKAILPTNLIYLLGVAYQEAGLCTDDEWQMMRMDSSIFHNQICPLNSLSVCVDCVHSFKVSPSLILTSTLANGNLMIAYKGYPTDDEGTILIPNDADLIEAITNFVLHKYWESKYLTKEDGADSRMQYYWNKWVIYSKKALNTNLPSLHELENIKNIWTRMVPRGTEWMRGYATLNSSHNAAV